MPRLIWSLLGAQSLCWFRHVVAHIRFLHLRRFWPVHTTWFLANNLDSDQTAQIMRCAGSSASFLFPDDKNHFWCDAGQIECIFLWCCVKSENDVYSIWKISWHMSCKPKRLRSLTFKCDCCWSRQDFLEYNNPWIKVKISLWHYRGKGWWNKSEGC